ELVQSRPSASITRFLSGTNDTFGVYTANALNYEVYTSGLARMRITSGGDVGIGTTTPNFSLAGRTTVDINGTSQAMLALSVGGVGKGFLFHTGTDLLVSNEGNGAIKLNTNGSQKVVIEAGGNVGIGTTSPASKLHVVGYGIFDDGTNGRLTFENASGQNDIYSTTTLFGAYKDLRYTANNHIFRYGSSEAMRITSGGNVGIGTSSPSTKLDVVGAITASGGGKLCAP
ncbi:MAG: hypothetical protein ACEQSB_06025, partial [Undibacterium sp.]